MTATAADPLVAFLVEDVAELHGSFTTALQDVTDDDFRQRPGALAPSIGFHL